MTVKKSHPNSSKNKKRTAKIVYRNGNNFWTTQKQFWAWIRSGIVEKTGESPLKGVIIRESELKLVVRNNAVLNLNDPTHFAEMIKLNHLKH